MKNQKHRKRLKKTIASCILAAILILASWLHDLHSAPIYLPEDGSGIEIHANQTQDNLRQLFGQAISNAEHSVTLLIYSLTDPYITGCLKKKAEEGIPVHIICDAKASPYIQEKVGDKISIVRRFGPGLMHQKILVVDGSKSWLGSANMTAESLRMHGNLVNFIDSPQFAEAVLKKASTLREEGRAPAALTQSFTIGDQRVELWFLPDNKQASIRLKELIRQATHSLQIAMFTWTRSDLAKEVIAASKRGVKVEVALDRNQSKGAGAHVVEMLKQHQINVVVSTGDALLHHKFAYIDGKTLVNGSANWTKAAFTQNDDCFIVLHDLTEKQQEQMNAVWSSVKQRCTESE